MKSLLTPKQVARAIGVSESSLKRWCDLGKIPTVRTPGGHRRLPISGVLDFLRSSQYRLVRPEVLGLPVTTGQTVRVVDRASSIFRDALLAGDDDQCRQAVLDLYLSQHSIAVICDRVVAAAFSEIGDRWACGEALVYQERRACEITRRVLVELRSTLPDMPESTPLATGGTPEGDFYELSTTMVELVLAGAGWNAQSLGSSLPGSTLQAAIRNTRPRLFWLSVSHIVDRDRFLEEYAALYDTAAKQGVAVAVGGQQLSEDLRQEMQYSAYCDNMQHLAAFATTLHNPRAEGDGR